MANVVMPKLTDTMEEGVLRKWYKKEGDRIESGDPIAEVETDKAIMDLEAFASGIVTKILVKEGATIPSGELIAVISDELVAPTEAVNKSATLWPIGTQGSLPKAVASSSIETPSPSTPSGGEGWGEAGRQAWPAPPVPLSMLRKTLAKRMMESKGPVPHFYLVSEMNMEKTLAFQAARTAGGTKLTLTEIFLKAVALTLKQFPAYRSSYTGDSVRISEQIAVGFAVGIPDGVITPVIRDCDQKSLEKIHDEVRDKIRRAREKGLTPSEYTGAVFSISNLGMYDVESFSAIITPPESGALAIDSILEKPVVRDQSVMIGKTVKVTLSTDHRVADGVLAAQFLQRLNGILQNPEQLTRSIHIAL